MLYPGVVKYCYFEVVVLVFRFRVQVDCILGCELVSCDIIDMGLWDMGWSLGGTSAGL